MRDLREHDQYLNQKHDTISAHDLRWDLDLSEVGHHHAWADMDGLGGPKADLLRGMGENRSYQPQHLEVNLKSLAQRTRLWPHNSRRNGVDWEWVASG